MERVRDWMTRKVISVKPQASVHEALAVMREGFLRHVVVREDDGSILGMVSSHDLVRVTLLNSGRVLDIDGCVTKDIMTPSPLQTVHPEDPLARAAQLLDELQIGALTVVEDGELVGILTTSDLLRTFWQKQTSPN